MKKISTKEITFCAIFIALTTVGAYIHIPLPLGDYYSLQLLFILLAGILLGPVYGTISTACYVLLGLLGVPVFAGGGGFGYIFNPSFGYLIGFIAGSWICGLIVSRAEKKTLKVMMVACFAALVVVYVIGLPYKYLILNYYTHTPITWVLVLAACFPIDLPCDIVLSFLCACLSKKLYSAFMKIYQPMNVQKSVS